MNIDETYCRWLSEADPSLQDELRAMEGDAAAIEDAFYRQLAFGTGGLRGILGAGTNRMNLHTVARASQGLADYVRARFPEAEQRIAVSYDSRLLSETFARTACGVFAANGIRAFIYPRLMPTPCLSYAVRALKCAAGVMVTASHNPASYNGYKVYGPDGGQITTEAAAEITACIERLDMFTGPKTQPFQAALDAGRVSWVPDAVVDGFIQAVKDQSLLGDEAVDKDVAIVYTPLNGTGLKPVLRTLTESGYTRVTVVPEQEKPDGRFPTCPKPNPELPEAMALGLRYARDLNADLLLATDPDCDRCGIAARDADGTYRLFTGNETGLLLLDYLCQRRAALRRMPRDPVLVKAIVTTDLAERIARRWGVETRNVLTGFKYIGEVIGQLEAEGRPERFLLGFEESYGYLTGSYVREKDGVVACLLIAEMFAWHRAHGVSLPQRLAALYAEYGYCLNTQHSYPFEGAAGFKRMGAIMAGLRGGVEALGGVPVDRTLDYAQGLDGLPASDVLKFVLADGAGSVVARPSGTEPKLKLYINVTAPDRAAARAREAAIAADLEARVREA